MADEVVYEDGYCFTDREKTLLNKIKYENDSHLEVAKNKFRPTIRYGLFPAASTKVKGLSE